jgi:hypothetical protein
LASGLPDSVEGNLAYTELVNIASKIRTTKVDLNLHMLEVMLCTFITELCVLAGDHKK